MMKVLFPKSLCLALGAICVPALAAAQSYLPLPETNAPVYRPVSSYYSSDAATGSSLINHVAEPPMPEADDVPSPDAEGDADAMSAPAAEYGKGGKSCGKGCGYVGCGPNGCLRGLMGGRGCWYAGANVIWMDRDNDDAIWLSVFDDAIDVSVLSSHDAKMDWTTGGEFTVGRYLHGGTSALEVNYWGLDPDREQATVLDPNAIGAAPNLLTSFDLSTLNYDDGVNPAGPIDGWFDGARIHRVRRNWNIENVELNFVHHSCCGTLGGHGKCGGCRRYNISTVFGLRYLNFDESFTFDADDGDTTFDGGAEEVRYDIDLDNHLLGFQLGCRADYYHNDCLGFHVTSNVGLYGNHIDHHSFIGGANGAAVVGAGPNAGEAFDIGSDKTDFAMIGEIDLGASYRLSRRWRATAGYRVIALSGVALPGQQIPTNFADIDGVANIGSESSLILHGGYAGLELNY